MNNKITAAKAKATTIYLIEGDEVVAENLFDFVMESEEMTTSPRGVMGKVFIEENEEREAWELREWMPNGRSRIVETFDSEEEAADEHFSRVYDYDFVSDDQRDTTLYWTREEAEKEIEARKSEA